MIPSALIAEPVVLVQRADSGTADEYGDPILEDAEVETFAYIEPFRAMEDTTLANQQADSVRIFLRADVDPTGYDALRRGDGSLYEINGPPGPVHRAWPPLLQHYELLARQVV